MFFKGHKPHNKGTFTSAPYTSVHKWLAKNFVKTKKCEHCPSTKFIEWALKKKKVHTHIRNNYLCLCSSCHKKYDYTPERCKKLSTSLKGRKITWGNKISKANMGRVLSSETKKKMSEYAIKNPKKRSKINGRFTN